MGNVLIAEGFTLGATWRHAIGDLPKKTGPVISRLGLSLFENSVLETTTNVFPFPSVQTAISKAVTPISGTQPFLVNLKTIYNRSLWECPPIVNLSIQRQVGLRNIAYLNWSSGTIFWPQFIIDLITTPSEDSPIIVSHDSSHIELGYTVVPLNKEILVERHTAKHVKADVEDYEARELAWEKARCDPQETWGVMVHSSPNTPLALTCNYARTLFAQRFEPGGDRVLSEWTGEGYKPNRPIGMNDVVEGSGIRLEISSMLRAEDLSVGWWIDGTRRITEFTKLGLGVGLQGGNGLMMHIVWKRLSQRIRVPIILVPVQNVTFNLCMLAAALPWTVYTLYEYGVRRPRQRKRWLKHARNERRRLERLVAGKREEALRAIQLMKDQVLRRQEKEQSRDGLVILSAEYGYIPPARSLKSSRTASAVAHDSRDPMTIDVTIPVAALVDQGQLNISDKVVKWQLIGFWDPAPLRPKTLCVRYLFQGQEHVVQVGDNEPLSCPMRTHLPKKVFLLEDDPKKKKQEKKKTTILVGPQTMYYPVNACYERYGEEEHTEDIMADDSQALAELICYGRPSSSMFAC
ncbi:hypothetical protein KEM56_004961 [Ascosphaera pollenicola]|nr:hypothetical protein KEM56_004961 [Ascosphaera pollenicola]